MTSAMALELLVSRPSLTDAQLRQVHGQLLTSSLLADRFLPNTLLRSLLPATPLRALLLFPRLRRLCSSFLPNNYTFSFLLTAAAAAACPSRSKLVASLHALAVVLRWDGHAYVSNGLIHAYASHGRLHSARRLFDHNVACRDVCSWTSLLTAYARAGRVQDARDVFDGMPHRTRTAVAWSAMVSAYVGAARFEEAIGMVKEMATRGVRPNRAAVVGALTACGALGALEKGRQVHGLVLVMGGAGAGGLATDAVASTALVDMYCKCGSLETARRVFSGMERDVFAYTAMITGLSDHGRCEEAIDMAATMQEEGIHPNEVTFLCVLTACGRAGLGERAKQVVKSMTTGTAAMAAGVEHYGSLVDALGRAGMVAEAAEVVRAMPMRPDAYVLGALLKACGVHGHTELGKQVAAWMAELGLDHSGVHVQLSNMHARSSDWDAVLRVRATMDHNNILKPPGSTITIAAPPPLPLDQPHPALISDQQR